MSLRAALDRDPGISDSLWHRYSTT